MCVYREKNIHCFKAIKHRVITAFAHKSFVNPFQIFEIKLLEHSHITPERKIV